MVRTKYIKKIKAIESIKEKLFCVQCNDDVNVTLVSGEIIYPHRNDLHNHRFYQCNHCKNYVGFRENYNKNFLFIPTGELRELRIEIHDIIDPIWQNGILTRKEVYKKISEKIGKNFHAGSIKSPNEAKYIIHCIKELFNAAP